MRKLRVATDCDRAMLCPQPTRWASGAKEAIEAILAEKWDEIALWEKDSAEEIAHFLRDHTEHCPPRVVIGWGLDPILQVKIKLWLTGKVYDWNAKSNGSQ